LISGWSLARAIKLGADTPAPPGRPYATLTEQLWRLYNASRAPIASRANTGSRCCIVGLCGAVWPRIGDRRGRVERVKIEVRYLEACPGHASVLRVVRALAIEDGAEPVRLEIETAKEAEPRGFLGSPTVRIGGVDVEPDARGRSDFALECGLYRGSGGQSGPPSRRRIGRALGQAAA
jgi:hypothetical protein